MVTDQMLASEFCFYPRNQAIAQYGARSATDQVLRSKGSAQGLVDLRMGSDASLDDDYLYHVLSTKLWDSFWLPETGMREDMPGIHPGKQYPSLISSPKERGRCTAKEDSGRRSSLWPTLDIPVQKHQEPIMPTPSAELIVPLWPNSNPGRLPRPESKGVLNPIHSSVWLTKDHYVDRAGVHVPQYRPRHPYVNSINAKY
jgi:hypothetical protein